MAMEHSDLDGAVGDRDLKLAQLYREGAREMPPARLDASIRAAARRAVMPKPGLADSFLRSWRMPVAITAVVVLSVSVVTLMMDEGPAGLTGTPATIPPVSQPQSRQPSPVAPQSLPGAPAQRAATTSRTEERESKSPQRGPQKDTAASVPARRERQPVSPAEGVSPATGEPPGALRSPAPPAARLEIPANRAKTQSGRDLAKPSGEPRREKLGDIATTPEAATAESEGHPGSSAAKRAMPQGEIRQFGDKMAPAPADAGSSQPSTGAGSVVGQPSDVTLLIRQFDRQPPENWIGKILALRRNGQLADAKEMLAEFTRRYPAYPLPPELR